MEDVISITVQTPLGLHHYADDTQLYMYSNTADISGVHSTLSGCINIIKKLVLFASSEPERPQNAAELLWFAHESRQNSHSVSVTYIGVFLDWQLEKISATCFFICSDFGKFGDESVTTRLVLAFCYIAV
jgi:hypothetical protein